ncbi:MAG: GNAT family N-acetyltransferase [Chlorobia bacterium]|nr:GNAT family N-acetyltransferase [Fimbriimonadaceae bacterium]
MIAIRKGDSPDIPAICDLWNAVWPHHHRGLQEMLRDQELLQLECRPIFWIAEDEDSVVGAAEFNRNVGSYHPLKWEFAISVLPEYRGQGIGTELYQKMLTHVESEGAISTACRVSDDDLSSIGFIERRRFEVIKRDFESELDLSSLDATILEAMSQCSVDIRAFAELDSQEFRRELHEVFEIVRVDTPRSEPPTRMAFEQFQALVIDEPEFLQEGSQVALIDGRIIGFTGIYHTEIDGQLFQWLTAVKREHRGKGIAKALKANAAKWAIANGYRTVRTDNDTRNAPMLAINDKLGFRRLPGMITFRKQLAVEAPQ